MDISAKLGETLLNIAERSAAIIPACTNEESTKHFLVLPVIGALGYDYQDPFVVQPECAADFRDGVQDRVDYVILRDGAPAIAIECKKVGTDLTACRGQLRGYFAALPTVQLGILTDGIKFEFFIDCEAENVMDAEPFLTLDLNAALTTGVPGDVVDALVPLLHANFQPDAIYEIAEHRLVAKRLRTVLMEEVREPSEEFCKLVLRRVGLKNLRRSSIQSRYGSMIRAAFEDAIVLPVLDLLRTSQAQLNSSNPKPAPSMGRIVSTDRELAVYRYVCRRLAFLAADEHLYAAIDRVKHRDYIGKFAVYYASVNKGRLFDFIEGANGFDRFVFPEPYGEVVTNSIADIDELLRTVFELRVNELGPERLQLLKRA